MENKWMLLNNLKKSLRTEKFAITINTYIFR